MSPSSSGGFDDRESSRIARRALDADTSLDALNQALGRDVEPRVDFLVTAEHDLTVAQDVEPSPLIRVGAAHRVDGTQQHDRLVGDLGHAEVAAECRVQVADGRARRLDTLAPEQEVVGDVHLDVEGRVGNDADGFRGGCIAASRVGRSRLACRRLWLAQREGIGAGPEAQRPIVLAEQIGHDRTAQALGGNPLILGPGRIPRIGDLRQDLVEFEPRVGDGDTAFYDRRDQGARDGQVRIEVEQAVVVVEHAEVGALHPQVDRARLLAAETQFALHREQVAVVGLDPEFRDDDTFLVRNSARASRFL